MANKKCYYVHYRTATGEHAAIVPAYDAFSAVKALMIKAGLSFQDLSSVKSCPVRLA